MSKIKYIKVMSELGAGTRGASLGYDALLTASHNKKSSTLNKFPTVEVPHQNHDLFEEITTPFAKYIHAIQLVFNDVHAKIGEAFQQGEFPILLTGDHANAAATIQGIKKANPNKRLGVIWIDAHADLHSPYTTPSGNVHGMPLAIALKEDNKENAVNNLDATTRDAWDKICGNEAAIKTEDLVFYGVRDTEIPEDELILAKNIKNVSVEELRSKGAKQSVKETLAHLHNCDIIYISFDVDSMDSAISDGTGTPVINGFSAVEVQKVISYLLASHKVCCFEIVEINPTLDHKANKMAETAFGILNEVVKIVSQQ